MPRNGNFVPGGGGNVRWADGISNSLNQLSGSLLEQDAQETRRQDQLSREQLLAKERKDASAEDKRRFELTFAQGKKANDLALRGEERKLQAEKDKLAANNVVWSALNEQKFSIDDIPTDGRRDKTRTLRDNLSKEREATLSFLDTGEGLDSALSSLRNTLSTSNLTQTQINNQVLARKNELEALKREDVFTGSKNLRNTTNDEIDKKFFSNRLQEIDDKVASGAFLTKEEKVSSLLKRIPKELQPKLDLQATRQMLSTAVSGVSESDLLQGEKERVAAANALAERELEFISEFYKKPATKRFSGKKSTSSGDKITEGVKYITQQLGPKGLNVGDTDLAASIEIFEGILADEDLDANVDHAVLAVVLGGYRDLAFVNGIDNLSDAKKRVLDFQNSSTSQGSGSKNEGLQQAKLDFKKYRDSLLKPKSLKELKSELLRVNKVKLTGLGALPMFLDTPEKRRNIRDELLNREAAKVEEAKAQEINDVRSTLNEARASLLDPRGLLEQRGLRSTFPGVPSRF